MKTIKPGKPIRGPEKWWVGLKLTCPNCQAEVQLEKKDFVTPELATDTGMPDWSLIQVYCPTTDCIGTMLARKGRGQLAVYSSADGRLPRREL